MITWGRGTKAPRSTINLEILKRIERRYRLSEGYFAAKMGGIHRAPGDYDLNEITPAQRRWLAWHLPDDFNRRSRSEQAEILDWVRNVIISGSTDYRRYQTVMMRQRYAVRFACASGPPRKSPIATAEGESRIINAPKRLNDEMSEILRFKTSTFAAFGLQRNGVWGEETASQKVERFGLRFGAFAAPPESEAQGFGADPKLLTFAMMIFPQVWDWYCQNTFYEAWRTAIQRYGIYNPWTGKGAIKGLLPHGPHNVRDVLATHILKQTGSYEQASYAIQDMAEMVAQHYERFLPQDKAEI